jgi:plastocyanin
VHRIPKAALAVAAAGLALPGAASAATKTVYTGPLPGKPPAGVPKDGFAAQFFPSSVRVHAGDSIRFQITGCPAVNLPRKGQAAPPVAVQSDQLVSGVKDAAGADFWFNGQARLLANPAVFVGVKSGVSYTGAKAIASGMPMGPGAPKPWVVKFPRTGTFTFTCGLFPGQEGRITVVRKSQHVPSVKADRARAHRQMAKAVATLKALAKKAPPAGNTIVAGPDAKTGEMLMRFTPAEKTVKVGEPVSLEMTPGSREHHTFTFTQDVKAAAKLSENIIGPVPGSAPDGPPIIGFDPVQVFRSEAAGTPLTYDATTHGGAGWANTGLLDGTSKSPFASKDSITFTKAGTYTFLCLLHPEMQGKVTVTG